ncbi:hypothetical protein QR685DRAFT_431336, partial [Neurospora intermedia]
SPAYAPPRQDKRAVMRAHGSAELRGGLYVDRGLFPSSIVDQLKTRVWKTPRICKAEESRAANNTWKLLPQCCCDVF